MSLYWALQWTQWLTALAVALQTFELLEVQKLVKKFWPWKILSREYPSPVRAVLGLALNDRSFPLLLWLRLFAAFLLLFQATLPLLLFLLLTSYLVNLRWRGTYNGGSDVMTFLLLGTLTATQLFGPSPKLLGACLWYLAIQSVLSYFVAGWVKLAQPSWRSGEALKQFLRLHRVELRLGANAAWAIMLFEAAFPVVLVFPGLTAPLLLTAFLFHLANAQFLGLNRFVYVWLATYPAILFTSRTLL